MSLCSLWRPQDHDQGRTLARCPGHEQTGWREGTSVPAPFPSTLGARPGAVRRVPVGSCKGRLAGWGRTHQCFRGDSLLPNILYLTFGCRWGSHGAVLAVLSHARLPPVPTAPSAWGAGGRGSPLAGSPPSSPLPHGAPLTSFWAPRACASCAQAFPCSEDVAWSSEPGPDLGTSRALTPTGAHTPAQPSGRGHACSGHCCPNGM